MFSLPPEVQLDVLKYLDFNQLFSIKQTNFYFCNLINKYEGELARMKFRKIAIIDHGFIRWLPSYKFIALEFGVSEFNLTDQLKKKWKTAIDKSIPLVLDKFGPVSDFLVCIGKTRPYLFKKGTTALDEIRAGTNYLLKLPNLPKNIEEMIIVRCLLEQLFKCAFDRAYFYTGVFNPEMINILFDNDKTIPLQFNIQKSYLSVDNKTFEDILKFSLNHLSISESLSIILHINNLDISEQYTNILYNIIINEGNKFPKIYLRSFKLTKLHDLIIEFITTSRDCSKMVPAIILNYTNSASPKLSERAEKIEIEQLANEKHTNYQIANIYNPALRFSFYNREREVASTFRHRITIMKL